LADATWRLQLALDGPDLERQINAVRQLKSVGDYPNALRAALALGRGIMHAVDESVRPDVVPVIAPRTDSPACGADAWQGAYRTAFVAGGILTADGSAGQEWPAFCERCAKVLPTLNTERLKAELDLERAIAGTLTATPSGDPQPTAAASPCMVPAYPFLRLPRAGETFPEVDSTGRVIGLNCRYRNSQKKTWPGGKRGLTVPAHWQERTGPILVPEGASDVLTLTALNLPAVGRPSNMGGVEQLAKLLGTCPAERPAIVLGEFDANDKGQWPGREGAVKTASELTAKLGRPVEWALPPDGAKDVRKWVLSKHPDPTIADAWHDLGQSMLGSLKRLNAAW